MSTAEQTEPPAALQASNPSQFVAAVRRDPSWYLVHGGSTGSKLRPRVIVAFCGLRGGPCSAAIFEGGKVEVRDFEGDWLGRLNYVDHRMRHAKL
ncbi:hypothetical protein [Nocardia jiangxiensis]|uniref:hypothetical protein n=1 Tax=Nocardia jiangxiensis TaxID=282685 RepID=UPI0012F6DEEF|nr:hypothetical protein [Nocardia jiangxiensis]